MRNVPAGKHDSALFACRQAMIEPMFGAPKQTAAPTAFNAEDESCRLERRLLAATDNSSTSASLTRTGLNRRPGPAAGTARRPAARCARTAPPSGLSQSHHAK
jgi:hypothetical protein